MSPPGARRGPDPPGRAPREPSLLLGRLERAGPLGLLAHPRDGVHDVALRGEKGVAQLGGPLDVGVGEALGFGQPELLVVDLGDAVETRALEQSTPACRDCLWNRSPPRIRMGPEGQGSGSKPWGARLSHKPRGQVRRTAPRPAVEDLHTTLSPRLPLEGLPSFWSRAFILVRIRDDRRLHPSPPIDL